MLRPNESIARGFSHVLSSSSELSGAFWSILCHKVLCVSRGGDLLLLRRISLLPVVSLMLKEKIDPYNASLIRRGN